MKKLLLGLLILAFVLGPVSGFWSRPVLANTEEELKVDHCVAWPWNDDFPGANNPSPPDTSGLNNAGNQVRMQNSQQNTTTKKTDPKDMNLFHLILHTLWEVIFPASF